MPHAAAATLPMLHGRRHLTDSGLETDLIFHHGVDLPAFAAFVLMRDEAGRALLEQYFREHVEVAEQAGLGCVLETPTWRAQPAWASAVGWSLDEVAQADADAVELVRGVSGDREVVVSGCVGPRADGYVVGERMGADEAQAYHRWQVELLAASGVDLVSLLTVGYPDEAIGFVRAACEVGVPAVVSFTVEVDGRLPDGTTLGAAVSALDGATDSAAAYLMVNCAHPDHVAGALDAAAPWAERLVGLRANASRRSHAELDEAEDLDDGDPAQLAGELVDLSARMPAMTVLGGCCGTDVRHIRAVADAWAPGPDGGTTSQ